MVLYLAGNEGAFDELFTRYRKRVYGFISKKIHDPKTVEDLFQTTFLKLHRSREHYEPGRLFSAWLFTICRNVIFDHLRKEKRAKQHRDQASEETPLIEFSTEKPDPQEKDEVLSLVSEKQRELLKLRYEEELAFEQIAVRMNTTAGNIRQMISRTVRSLKGKRNG